MSTSKTDNHAKGQQDRSQGNNYNRPHSHTKEFFTWPKSGLEKINTDNGNYAAGWRNADKQSK